MRAFFTMTMTNCKLLLRSIGFLLCMVLLPVGASALHMVQTSDNYADSHGGVAQIEDIDSTVIMDTKNVTVLVADAANDEFSELLLRSLAAEDWCSVGHYRCESLSPEELKKLWFSLAVRVIILFVLTPALSFTLTLISKVVAAVGVKTALVALPNSVPRAFHFELVLLL